MAVRRRIRRQLGIGFGQIYAPVSYDAGGARERELQREQRLNAEVKSQQETQKRVAKAAGRIPLLRSVKQVVEYTQMAHADFFGRYTSNSMSFPALQIARSLDLDEVFAALPQQLGKKPNVMAKRFAQPSVGPHFDHYYTDFRPWTIHENLMGKGVIRARFLPAAQFDAYKAMAKALPETAQADELLAQNRATMGAMALSGVAGGIYVGDIRPGTRTLLWHGENNVTSCPPVVHEVIRDEPGDYRIYAHQEKGSPGEGFQPIS